MLKIGMTFERLFPRKDGEYPDIEHGWVYEPRPTTARELAHLIERAGFVYPSDSHGTPRWLNDEGCCINYATGVQERRAIHPGRDSQSQRVWARVLRIVGHK